ncbi:MAG: thiamine-phosphate kinase [Bacteroidales bacterium]
MNENNTFKKTDLNTLGEFGLIDRLTKNIKIHHKETIKGVGDDAAVFDYDSNRMVVTTDLLLEGVHFNLAYTPLKHLGYKAVTVNISDLLAMNAVPKQILVSIAVSNRFGVEAIDELYSGIISACDDYRIDLAGGDTSSSVQGLMISISAFGAVTPEKTVYRSGANDKDILCVTGNLGAAYMGLQLLERENKIFKSDPSVQPDLKGHEYILQRQLRPLARTDINDFFDKVNLVPTAMIDISDGLSSEAIHLCRNSNKGCIIYEEKIPIADETVKMADELGIEPIICALNGGEDYELLFAIKPEDFVKIENNTEITPIGYFTSEKGQMLLELKNGKCIPLSAQGWNAFLNQ